MKKYSKCKYSNISWLGEVPEHWEVLSLSNTIKHRSNGI